MATAAFGTKQAKKDFVKNSGVPASGIISVGKKLMSDAVKSSTERGLSAFQRIVPKSISTVKLRPNRLVPGSGLGPLKTLREVPRSGKHAILPSRLQPKKIPPHAIGQDKPMLVKKTDQGAKQFKEVLKDLGIKMTKKAKK